MLKVDPILSEENVKALYKEKVKLVHNLLLNYDMSQRVYWASPVTWEHSVLRSEEFVGIPRCVPGATVFKVLIMWLLGLLWLCDIPDHNYNMMIITDFKYEQIKQKLR